MQELLRPGSVALTLALELTEFLHPPANPPSPAVSEPATEAVDEDPVERPPVPTIRRRTNAIAVKVAEAPGIFRTSTEESRLKPEESSELNGERVLAARVIGAMGPAAADKNSLRALSPTRPAS